MAKETTYRQCTCEKVVGATRQVRTFWADDRKAIPGNVVKIEEADGRWSEGWTVSAVYGEPTAEKYVNQMRHAHTKQRKCSDI